MSLSSSSSSNSQAYDMNNIHDPPAPPTYPINTANSAADHHHHHNNNNKNTTEHIQHVTDLTFLSTNGAQTVDCPNCHQRAQTAMQGRSEGKKKFMNVFWWPLPDRKHWWEETKWTCTNCDVLLATQKHGKNVEVLV